MNKTITFLIVASILALTGCQKTDEVKTTEWYKLHDKERVDMLAKCHSNPGELRETPNCINARSAQSNKTWSSRKGIEVAPLTAKDIYKKDSK